MQARFQVTADEYVEAQVAHLKATHGNRLWLVRLGSGVIAIAGIYFAWDEPRSSVGYAMAICGVALFALFTWVYRAEARREFHKQAQLREEVSADFGEQSVAAHSSLGDSTTKWDAYTRFVETEHLFLLYFSPAIYHIVPKRSLPRDGVDEFRNLLCRKLPPAKS